MRWHPIASLCLLHLKTTAHLVACPAAGIRGHDEYRVNHTKSFHSTQYLAVEEKLKPEPLSAMLKVFTRSVPARYLAEASLWAVAEMIQSTFQLAYAKDSFGNKIEINDIFHHGMLGHATSLSTRAPTQYHKRHVAATLLPIVFIICRVGAECK